MPHADQLTPPREHWDDDDDDETEPMPGEVRIRKPWDVPRDVARRFWPEALAPRRPVARMCAHCRERPAALASWRPNHPIFDSLCIPCRSTICNLAIVTSVREQCELWRILDRLILALGLYH